MSQPPDALEDINVLIGRNLRKLRMKYAISQDHLSNILNVSHQQVQKYEAGRNRLPLEKLILIKRHFDLPYDFFFDGWSHIPSPHPYGEEYDLALYRLKNIDNDTMRQKTIQIINLLCT